MKRITTILIILIISSSSFSQEYSLTVDSMIDEVNLDSLSMFVRDMTGEDSVMVNGNMVLIEHRVSWWGNDLAADYLTETLEGYGLEVIDHQFGTEGHNIIGIQEGTLYPDQYYIVCAHYDAVDYYCADDNASGSAAVLEAARILSQTGFEYSIMYALWDEEETGLIGSSNYAQQAASNNMDILSVINLDMIAWDSDDDMVAEIHTKSIANSTDLADYMVEIDDIYQIGVNPVLQNPGATASDHSSFWNQGYSAILLIEEYFGGDFNPYYHSENDRISIFNLDYFHEMSKLAIGSLVSLAAPIELGTGIEEQFHIAEIRSYPNPFSEETTIEVTVNDEQFVKMSLFNQQGTLVSNVHQGEISKGVFIYKLSGENLSSGMYFLVCTTSNGSQTHRLIVK